MCSVKYLSVTFSVGLPVKIDNPVTASQVRFNNSVSSNAFASKAAPCAVIVGQSGNDSEFFY